MQKLASKADGKSESPEISDISLPSAVVVTSNLLEAFLACPTKCHLLFVGERPTGNDYTAWTVEREESYRLDGIIKLASQSSETGVASQEPRLWKHEFWSFVIGRTVLTDDWEASIALVQRIPKAVTVGSLLVPVRFISANKLSSSDKLIAAYEALTLSKSLGTKVGVAKIIHGDKRATFSVKASALSRIVHRKVSQVVALLSNTSPPDLILNRHCPECGFQDRCRTDTVEKDDLSLLAHLSDKERVRLRGKGIFTVAQLSYTFRPRRRSKRLAARSEKYHHALKALAIREKKTHVIGKPALVIEGTPIFFDVESLPDRDFYYLIGLRIEGRSGVVRHTLWADSTVDEKRIWEDFLRILSQVDCPSLVHYGSLKDVSKTDV